MQFFLPLLHFRICKYIICFLYKNMRVIGKKMYGAETEYSFLLRHSFPIQNFMLERLLVTSLNYARSVEVVYLR